MAAVREMIFGLRGTGIFPPRQSLIEKQDADGITAADLARRGGHDAIAELLDHERLRMEYHE